MPVMLRTAPSTPNVSIATLDNGKANALDLAMIETLMVHVHAIGGDGALVIEGTEGMFTGGLDLAVLGKGDEAASELMGAMGRLLVRILDAPRPVVVAADGHGIAAGAMLMLVADRSVVGDGQAAYGFAEVANGLPLPAGAIELVRQRVAPQHVVALTAHAVLIAPADAVAWGLASEVVAAGTVTDRAVEIAAQLAALPPQAYLATKQMVNAPVVDAMR
ncbi:MAG: enoyl-CoA hydratase-related protein [Actinomycetota bacterium]